MNLELITHKKIQKELRKHKSKEYAAHSHRFFKTGPGEYGEGDLFLGIRVPKIRKIAKKCFQTTSIKEAVTLAQSPYHEDRLCGLVILVNKYIKTTSDKEKNLIYKTYVSLFPYINNWDLVDVTTPHLIGRHLLNKDRKILYKWVKSRHLWTRRIAILTNWWFIKNGDLNDVFALSEQLLNDKEDLIHKAVGWMLREAGKVTPKKLYAFLDQHTLDMPRTMLRYAIERLPEKKRKAYLNKK